MMRIIRRALATDADAIAKLYSELKTFSTPSVSPERIATLATKIAMRGIFMPPWVMTRMQR